MQAFLRHRLTEAFAHGFPLLRRIPSTTVWRTLGYLESLSEAERLVVFDACTSIAKETLETALGLAPVAAVPVGVAADDTPRAVLFRAIFSNSYWSAFPDRFMRQFHLDADGLAKMVDASRTDAILGCEPPVVAKAAGIRKVLHKYLKTFCQATVRNQGGGEWSCMGRLAGQPFGLYLDYGGMGTGFRYGVQFPRQTDVDCQSAALTIEATYGFPTGIWDFPLADELPELCETITEVMKELAIVQSAADRH